MREKDAFYMQRALELAEQARGRTSPNPMVGAVIVNNGTVVGQGYHKRAGTPHAEVHALREAGALSRGATMYVTLEPCSHFGRTPPCSKAVIEGGLARVVVAVEDPNPLVAGRGITDMRQAGLEVEVGVLADEAKQLNEVFIKYITTRRPFVLLKTAMTLDGKIATSRGHSRWITSAQARDLVHEWRDCYDAILVGVGTVLADDPLLTARPAGNRGKNPLRVILDSRGRTPLTAAVLNSIDEAKTLIVTTDKIERTVKERIEAKGAEVLMVPGKSGRPNLELLMEELGRREVSSLFVEGGATVNAAFLKEQLVDKVAWFIAPKIVGGNNAPGPVNDLGVNEMHQALQLKNLDFRKIGHDLLLEGYTDYLERER